MNLSIYEVGTIYRGLRIFFYFLNPSDAINVRDMMIKTRPVIEDQVRVLHYVVLDKLPKDFEAIISDTFDRIDHGDMIEEFFPESKEIEE